MKTAKEIAEFKKIEPLVSAYFDVPMASYSEEKEKLTKFIIWLTEKRLAVITRLMEIGYK